MTPKEKAKVLVDKFYQLLPLEKYVITHDGDLSWEYNSWNNAKQCASIAVDEIIDSFSAFDFSLKYIMNRDYWLDVKQEIEKL